VFENRMLIRIFGPKRNEVTGERRRLNNEELCDFYSSPSIIRIISQVEEGELGGTCSRNVGEEECVYVIGGKAREKETARKTKLEVDE
jgi:hypothetical protein